MREFLEIMYHCDAEGCSVRTRIWEENGRWAGYDLKSQEVLLKECGLPLPPTWTTIGDQHFCPNHNIIIHGEVPVGEDVDILRTGGLYEPIPDAAPPNDHEEFIEARRSGLKHMKQRLAPPSDAAPGGPSTASRETHTQKVNDQT